MLLKYLLLAFTAIFWQGCNAYLTAEQEAILPSFMEYLNRAFEGYAVEDFVPNTYNCMVAGVDLYLQANYTHHAFVEARNNSNTSFELYGEPRVAWKNMTLNVTSLISDDIGDLWHFCATAGVEWYDTVVDYIRQFEGEEYYGWPISALQALLENIIHITQINQALVSTEKAKDYETFSFLLGRLLRILIWVEPELIDSLDEDNLGG